MRITQGLEQTQFLTALNQLESSISQTQNEISTRIVVHDRIAKPRRRRARDRLQSGAGTEPAIPDQRQQRAGRPQYRGQCADAGAKRAAELCATLRSQANNATVSAQDRSAIATQATQIQGTLAVARQHAGRQRQLHLRRLRDANSTVCLERHRRHVRRRSGSAAGADRGGPNGGRRRQRRSRLQSNQDGKRHIHRDRRGRQHGLRRPRRHNRYRSGGLRRRHVLDRFHGTDHLSGA